MDSSLLEAPGTTPCTAPSAPGQSIPAWLYRRALFLLDRDWMAGSAGSYIHIRDVLTTQTGIRIPDALMSAIVAQFASCSRHVIIQIRAFPEEDMSPTTGDQIQVVRPVREQTTTTSNATNRPSGMNIREIGDALLDDSTPIYGSTASTQRRSASATSFPATLSNASPSLRDMLQVITGAPSNASASRGPLGASWTSVRLTGQRGGPGPAPNDPIAEEARKRLQQFREQAEARREADRIEREKEAAHSDRRDEAGGIEDSNAPLNADATSSHSPRALEVAEILLRFRDEVLHSSTTSIHLQSIEVNRETEQISYKYRLQSRQPSPGQHQPGNRQQSEGQMPAMQAAASPSSPLQRPLDPQEREHGNALETLRHDSIAEHPVSPLQQRLSDDDDDKEDVPPDANNRNEDTNANAERTDIEDDVALGSESEELSTGHRDRLVRRRLGILVEAVRLSEGIGSIETESPGDRVPHDLNYIADPADYRLFRNASGQERRVIRHGPPSLPSSPPRADRRTDGNQFEPDPNLHYWTSVDGLRHDMKEFKPDPNPAPPKKRKWEDVIAAAQEEQERLERGGVTTSGKAKGKRGSKAAGPHQKAKAGGSTNEPNNSPAKRTATVRRRGAGRTPPSAGTSMRETRSAAKRRREEAIETDSSDASGKRSDKDKPSGSDEAPPPPKRLRLRLLVGASTAAAQGTD